VTPSEGPQGRAEPASVLLESLQVFQQLDPNR
jgi:hypothetical protein